MDPIFCKALLGVVDAVVSADTCASAMAAIRAAEIQADASRFAGWLTMVAGVGALVAGCIAYAGQLKAANIQVRMVEKRERIEQRTLAHKYISNIVDTWREIDLVRLRITEKEYREDSSTLSGDLVISKKLCPSLSVIDWSQLHEYDGAEKLLPKYLKNLNSVVSTISILDKSLIIVKSRSAKLDNLQVVEQTVLAGISGLEDDWNNVEAWTKERFTSEKIE